MNEGITTLKVEVTVNGKRVVAEFHDAAKIAGILADGSLGGFVRALATKGSNAGNGTCVCGCPFFKHLDREECHGCQHCKKFRAVNAHMP